MTTTGTGLDFAVGPVTSERVQLWASLAGQAVTRPALDVLVSAFSAFWWEDSAYRSFQEAFHLLWQGEEQYASDCLDMLVGALEQVANEWHRVLDYLGQSQQLLSVSSQHHIEPQQRIEQARVMLPQVVEWITVYCSRSGRSLPLHTRAYLAAQQQRTR